MVQFWRLFVQPVASADRGIMGTKAQTAEMQQKQ